MGTGWDEVSDATLGEVIAFAASSGTAQLTIVGGGEVVVDERFDPEPVDVYAVQKGLVSVLVGIAEDRGLLSLDDPVSDHLGRGWTHLPPATEHQLRIRTVLNMTAGVDDDLRPHGQVGVSWRYDNISYNYLKSVLETVTARSYDPTELRSRGSSQPRAIWPHSGPWCCGAARGWRRRTTWHRLVDRVRRRTRPGVCAGGTTTRPTIGCRGVRPHHGPGR